MYMNHAPSQQQAKKKQNSIQATVLRPHSVVKTLNSVKQSTVFIDNESRDLKKPQQESFVDTDSEKKPKSKGKEHHRHIEE